MRCSSAHPKCGTTGTLASIICVMMYSKESDSWLLGGKDLMFASSSGANTPTTVSFELMNRTAPIVELGTGVQVWLSQASLRSLQYSMCLCPRKRPGFGLREEGLEDTGGLGR